MAEILLLPVRAHGLEQTARLHSDLAAAHTRGEDLGSRVPHIQAGSDRLRELGCVLQDSIDDLDLSLNKLGLCDLAAGDAVRKLLGTVQGLADTAKRFPPSSSNARTSKRGSTDRR